jgi:hypothetical protein
MKPVDVVALSWATSPDRDQIMATLICNYLEMQGVSLHHYSLWDGFETLYKHKPRLLFLMNPTGAVENFETMRYAHRRGLLGVGLIAEGIFQGNQAYLDEMIWGWNVDKHIYEDIQLQWCRRTKDITVSFHPEVADKIAICGGVGFDNYKIKDQRVDRKALLDKYGKGRYTKTIGIGCFDFDIYYPFDKTYHTLVKNVYTDDVINRFRQDGLDFDRELSALARAHPDILFIVKFHPHAETEHQGAAVTGMKDLPNTLFLRNEEPLIECIGLSDIWIVYDSTTALEAELLGVPSCHLNPSGRDFPRAIVNEGFPIYTNKDELSAAIDSFYMTGKLPGMSELDAARRTVIERTIGWDDGLNHVRAGNAIIDLLESSPTPVWSEESMREMLLRWKQHVKWLVGPFIRRYDRFLKSAANRHLFSMPELRRYQQTKLQEQQAYYAQKGLSLSDLRQIKCLK